MIHLSDVEAAAARLSGVAHRTPVLTSRTLDARASATVLCKAENFQRGGAFKFRGAYNAVANLAPAARERGVAAFSSGNHAQALALAARLHGTTAVIVMPEDTPVAKLQATREYGAEIVSYDRYSQDREEMGRALAEERGLTLIPPYEHPDVIAGQGTAGLELWDEAGPFDVLLAPIGGGGLIAGCGTALKGRQSDIRVVGVEPEAGDDTRRSLAAGERVRIGTPRTIADGLQAEIPGDLTFSINAKLVDEVVTVSDDDLRLAMAFAFDRMKVTLEPSGAAAIAALLSGAVAVEGQRVGAILSGGNVGIGRFCALLGDD